MLLLYVLEAPSPAILDHLARRLPVDEILVAIPAKEPLAARIAAREVELAAAKIGAPKPRTVRLAPHSPHHTIKTLYQELGDHREIHAYIDANPATTATVTTALALHALTKDSSITLELATHDPNQPTTTLDLTAMLTIAERLPPRLHDTARILYQKQHVTPDQLAREKRIAHQTAKKMLRTLEKRRLAEETRLGSYTATPLLSLYINIHDKPPKPREQQEDQEQQHT